MSRGIYILANDRVLDQAIALLNSIRAYDADTPIVMIPYNEQYQVAAERLQRSHGVQVYDDVAFLQRLSDQLQQICGDKLFDRPNLLRKLACWFGPFEEFLYIDTDIVVFEKIVNVLDHLTDYGFLCYDYQYTSGIKQVFMPKIIEDEIFSDIELKDVFNSGFWASKKGLLTEENIYDTFRTCASHPEYFFLLNSDQTVLNHLVLKHISHRLNLAQSSQKQPGCWAGSKHFQQQGNTLLDAKVDLPLRYLHWAGVRIQPGGAYWDIWKSYRYLHEPAPTDAISVPPKKKIWQKLVNKVRSKF
ncbi:MAG TPA: Npun_R2821/Npun_R2822 family protein [Candidatus Obscuribacterales bacterium]